MADNRPRTARGAYVTPAMTEGLEKTKRQEKEIVSKVKEVVNNVYNAFKTSPVKRGPSNFLNGRRSR